MQGAAPLDVTFAVQRSSGNEVSYDWSFGDGDIAGGSSASHIFQYEGTYLVTLKTIEESGSFRVDQVKVRVTAPPALQ